MENMFNAKNDAVLFWYQIQRKYHTYNDNQNVA